MPCRAVDHGVWLTVRRTGLLALTFAGRAQRANGPTVSLPHQTCSTAKLVPLISWYSTDIVPCMFSVHKIYFWWTHNKQPTTILCTTLRLIQLVFGNLLSGISLLASAGECVNLKSASICKFCSKKHQWQVKPRVIFFFLPFCVSLSIFCRHNCRVD